MPDTKIPVDNKKLIRRYLIWCYKTTKEELERIDRKFTQLQVDEYLLKMLQTKNPRYQALDKIFIDDFRQYMDNKKADAENLKFTDKDKKRLKPAYVYLQRRLDAIERAIIAFLGKKGLFAIQRLYDNEMTRRILE